MSKLHLILPMAGRGSRFFENGFISPKPLIEINGKPFFYWSAQSVMKFVDVADISFVVLQEHVDHFSIDQKIREHYPQARIVVIPEVLPGAVMTCLEGVKGLDDGPLLFNDCDHMFICHGFYDSCSKGDFLSPDAALLTFCSDESKYSFAKLDENGRVLYTVEKKAVSKHAICGAYYFSRPEIFLSAAEKYLTSCSYEEFFMSGVYNVLIDDGADVKIFETDLHISFGTPEEYAVAAADSRLEEVDNQ